MVVSRYANQLCLPTRRISSKTYTGNVNMKESNRMLVGCFKHIFVKEMSSSP